MNNQDWYLNQFGITQYLLRKPAVLKGEASIDIAENIQLIVITQSEPVHKIFSDILTAIGVSRENCLILSPAQLILPLDQIKQAVWFINEMLPNNWIDSPVMNEKMIIETPSLVELAASPHLKRQLWNTLCQYENYFNTHSC